jgi:hypothetical protein
MSSPVPPHAKLQLAPLTVPGHLNHGETSANSNSPSPFTTDPFPDYSRDEYLTFGPELPSILIQSCPPGSSSTSQDVIEYANRTPLSLQNIRKVLKDASTQTEIFRDLSESDVDSSIEDDDMVPSPPDLHIANREIGVLSRESMEAQQVGFARIRIEMLSLSRSGYEERGDEDYDADTDVSEDSVTENDEFMDNTEQPLQDSGQSNQAPSSASAPQTGSSVVGMATQHSLLDGLQLSQRRRRRAGDDDDDGNRRKRRRTKPKDRSEGLDKLRFACPYQAHEKWRDCFRPWPLNPGGGCDGIARLKYVFTPLSYAVCDC